MHVVGWVGLGVYEGYEVYGVYGVYGVWFRFKKYNA